MSGYFLTLLDAYLMPDVTYNAICESSSDRLLDIAIT